MISVLALNFSLNDKVVEELLKVGVRNLEEFRFLFEDKAKVGALRRFTQGCGEDHPHPCDSEYGDNM